MEYAEQQDLQSLELLRSSATLRWLVAPAKSAQQIANEPHAQAWQTTRGRNTSLVKYWPVQCMLFAGAQVLAGCQTAALLCSVGDGSYHGPLLALPLLTISAQQHAIVTNTPCADVSAAKMQATEWKGCSATGKEQNCKALVTSMLLDLRTLEPVPDDSHQPKRNLHHDIKMNDCCAVVIDKKYGFIMLADNRAVLNTNKQGWFSCRDLRFLRSKLCVCPAAGCQAALGHDGLKAVSLPSLGLYQAGFTVVRLSIAPMLLPLHPQQHRSDVISGAHCTAVYNISWANSPEAAAMPAIMSPWLFKVSAFDPIDTPVTAAVALRHPWLASVVGRVLAASPMASAAPARKVMLEDLQNVNDTSSSRHEVSCRVKQLLEDEAGYYRSRSTPAALSPQHRETTYRTSIRPSCSGTSRGSSDGSSRRNSSNISPQTPEAINCPGLSLCRSSAASRSNRCSCLVTDAAFKPPASQAEVAAPVAVVDTALVHVRLLPANAQPQLQAGSKPTAEVGTRVARDPASLSMSCLSQQQHDWQTPQQQHNMLCSDTVEVICPSGTATSHQEAMAAAAASKSSNGFGAIKTLRHKMQKKLKGACSKLCCMRYSIGVKLLRRVKGA